MNRIAKRRLLIVAAVTGMLAIGTGGLYTWRQHTTALHFRDLRAEGMAAAKADNFQLAVNDLQQYLARYSNDVEALGEYCRVRPKVIAADRSHLRETMTALRYYVGLKPDAVEQRRELLKLYLDYNLNTEALDAADRLIVKEPDNADLLAAKTQALARLRRTNEALATARHWAEVAPLDTQAQQSRIELMKMSNVDDATILKDADALVAAHPDLLGMRIVRAQALLQANRVEDGRTSLTAAATMPAAPSEMRTLAEMMDRVGLFDESVKLLTKLASADASSADSQLSDDNRIFLARRLWERGDSDAFLKFTGEHLTILDQAPELLAVHGILQRRAGHKAEGDADLAKLKADPTPVAKAWSAVLNATGDSITAEIAKQQIDLVSDALIDRPTDAYLLYFLGEAYAQTGDQELAVSMWQRAARNAPAWAIPPMRASIVLASQGRYEEAMEQAQMAAARSQRLALPNYLQIWTGAVEAGRRSDGSELLKIIEQALPQAPDQPWLRVSHATTLCALHRTDDARAAINGDLQDGKVKLDQNALLRLQALSRVYKLGLDDVLSQRIHADYGTTADGALTDFFRAYLGDGKAGALDAFEKARATAAQPGAKSWLLAEARIRDFLRDPKAIDSWKAAIADHGDDVEVIQAALSSSSLWSDRAVVDGLIEKLRALSGDRGLNWRLHRARWLIEGSTDQAPDIAATKRAADLLTAVLVSTPDAVPARFWQARCQARLGNRAAAIEHLMTATRLSPRSAPIALYSAQLLQEQGDIIRARQQLERLSTEDLADPEQNAMAAQLLAQQGKPEQAIELLEQSRNLAASEQSDLLLALLYQRQGENEKTDAIITRLLQQPTLTAVAFAADFYRARGKADVAERTLQKLYALQLAPGVREMTLADYNLRSGDLEQAQKFSEAATVAAPQNVAAWRSLLLAQLQAGKIAEADATLTKAAAAMPADAYLQDVHSSSIWPLISQVQDDTFRALTMAVAADPKNDAAREALTVVKNEKGVIDRKLVDAFLQLSDKYPLSQPLQVVTGQLLLNAGREADAAALATRGVETFPTDGALPRLAAQAMLAAHEWSQAKAFAATWRKQAGADLLPPDLLSSLASMKLGDAAAAENTLRPYVTYAMDRLEQHGDVIRTFALACYATGKVAEAEQTVDQAIARRPAFAREWLDAVGSDLATGPATRWLNRLDPQLIDGDGATLLTRVWLQLSLRTDSPPDARDIVRQRLTTISGRADVSGGSLVVLAVIADQIDEDDLAEKLYRRALSQTDVSPVAMNNLAMLLLSQNRSLDEADTLTRKATELQPEYSPFYDTRAQVMIAAGKAADARAAIDQALKLDPQSLTWRLTSAEVSVAEGKLKDAGAAVDAITVDPNLQRSLGKEDLARLDKLRARLTATSSASPEAAK